MQFCPICSNCLLVERTSKNFCLICMTCDYNYPIERPIQNILTMQKKQVDDILGGKEAWENVDQTEADCPKCSHKRAFYMQIQIRSADEPMTLFYKCVKCSFQWREN